MNNKVLEVAKEVNSQLDALESEEVRVALQAFSTLEKYAPETAKLALEAFDEREHAALWFTGRIRSLGWLRPWQCLAQGDIDNVHRILYSIIYGVLA